MPMKKSVAQALMESSAVSGVICLQLSTPPQPKVNRLWDLLEKVSPVCRTYWIAMGRGAWRDDAQAQADQVPGIPRTNKTASRSCVQTAGLEPAQPCITLLGGARSRFKQQPSHIHPGRVRQLHCSRLHMIPQLIPNTRLPVQSTTGHCPI